MAFSDLCHISNAYKSVENEPDQSDRIMEENSMVRDLITKILDETGPTEGSGSIQPQEKTVNSLPNHYPKNDTTTFAPNPSYMYNYQDQNGFYPQNGFGYVNYNENDVLPGVDPVEPTTEVTPERLNLLRIAAQTAVGGAQFSPNKFDEKYYNFFDSNQRNLPDNMFNVNNFNRPNSLNLDFPYENPYQRFPNNQTQDDMIYMNGLERTEMPNMDFKMPLDNGHYQNEDYQKMQEQKMFFNRNFQKNLNGEFYMNDMMLNNDRPMNQMDYPNTNLNFKPNGYHQDFMRRDVMPRDFQANGNIEQRSFENRDNMQQAMMRQNQELARQMSIYMRNRPPPNQLNVDVNFMHENTPFNLGLGALIGPSPPVPPPVLPSPMVEMPLAPFYAMRNMRAAATSSGILHARLDACYEQWRQLERERKRTEARLALAYPGRAVSSSNSIPVPRLPSNPTRVDRLTVDMLREHTKVLTLMGKMETLRASVCLAQNKRLKPEDAKITVLKRGQENVEKENKDGVDPATFDPSTWREDVKNMSEIAPHSEVESAMLAWRSAVALVQQARRREASQAQPHPTHPQARQQGRYNAADPIMQLADAVKQLCLSARRARCAMWCDLALTVALAPHDPPTPPHTAVNSNKAANTATNNATVKTPSTSNTAVKTVNENAQSTSSPPKTTQAQENANGSKLTTDSKDEKPSDTKTDKPEPKPAAKQPDQKNQPRRQQNYRKLQRNDFYQKNQRYDNRFTPRPPYYLATGLN